MLQWSCSENIVSDQPAPSSGNDIWPLWLISRQLIITSNPFLTVYNYSKKWHEKQQTQRGEAWNKCTNWNNGAYFFPHPAQKYAKKRDCSVQINNNEVTLAS